jgi:lambda family phage minor tail protein L
MSESNNLTLQADVQSLNPAPAVELFELDTTPLTAVNGVTGAGATYNWMPGTLGDAPAYFGGVAYTPMPIEFVDMKTTGGGTTPAPIIRISSLGGMIGSLISSFNDLVGAKVTRIRTFQDCLDGQVNADPSAFIGPDIFYIDQKSHQDKTYAEFTLAVSYDAQGRTFPARQIIADACQRTYRYWNGEEFVYGTCPYGGSSYFDTSGNAVADPALDFCSKKLATGCLMRFGNMATLPTYAFPGASLTGMG